MSYPTQCPKCDANLDGGPIPERLHEHYAPPYRWSRVIALVDREKDERVSWMCPDCNWEWPA